MDLRLRVDLENGSKELNGNRLASIARGNLKGTPVGLHQIKRRYNEEAEALN